MNTVSASQAGIPQDDLPSLHAPVSPSMRLVVDRSFHEQDRLRPLVDGSVVELTPADVVALRRILRDPGEGDTIRNEAANHLRREGIRQVAEDCILVLQQAGESPRFRSFAMQHLGMLWLDGQIRDPSFAAGLYPVLIGALRDRDHEVQREALWALTCGHDAEALVSGNTYPTDGYNDLIVWTTNTGTPITAERCIAAPSTKDDPGFLVRRVVLDWTR